MSVRVLLADDHKIMREGLKALLERQFDIQVMAEAENGLEAVRLTQKLKPDIVIMDIGMDGVERDRGHPANCCGRPRSEGDRSLHALG